MSAKTKLLKMTTSTSTQTMRLEVNQVSLDSVINLQMPKIYGVAFDPNGFHEAD